MFVCVCVGGGGGWGVCVCAGVGRVARVLWGSRIHLRSWAMGHAPQVAEPATGMQIHPGRPSDRCRPALQD